jgi:hypothetical protein
MHILLNHPPSDSSSAHDIHSYGFGITAKMSGIPAVPRSLKESVQTEKSEAGSSKGRPTATSLYDLSVPTFLQTVSAVGDFLDRAAAHCAETGADPDDFVHARLFHDMAPFHFQIECVAHHSAWALEAVKNGVFAPPALVGPIPFAGLRAKIAEAEALLLARTPDEVNSWAGKDLDFQIGPRRLAFAPETFILSFALPNFHFHAVTAYDILRSRGVPIGKRDYEGRLRTLPAQVTDS